MKSIDEQIEVMEAFSRGEVIQKLCQQEGISKWVDDGDPLWYWLDYDYRVKPPRHLHIVR